MLYTETVEKDTLALIISLQQCEELKEFRLVGGTALSLQIGHRKSIDIDLFSDQPFDSVLIREMLMKKWNPEKIQILKNCVFVYINGIKVDILSHQYPWQNPVLNKEGIRMADLKEIGAMKLHAMWQKGSRMKDFVDIYFLLEHHSLNNLASVYVNKYPDVNEQMAKTAVSYFDDIDKNYAVDYLNKEIPWKNIEKRLKEAVLFPNKVFTSPGKKLHL